MPENASPAPTTEASAVTPVTTETPTPEVKAPETTATPAEVAKIKKRFKINGEEREYEYTPEQFDALAQRGLAANKVFEETKKERARIQSALEKLNANPMAWIEDAVASGRMSGDKARELLEKYVYEKYIEPETLDPKDRQIRELQAKASKADQIEAAHRQAQEQARLNAEATKIKAGWEKTINETFTAMPTIPNTKAVRDRMAYYVHDATQNGLELTPAQLGALVIDDLKKEHGQIIPGMSGDELLALVGEEGVKKLTDAQLKKLGKTIPSPTQVVETPKNEKKVGLNEYFRNLEKDILKKL